MGRSTTLHVSCSSDNYDDYMAGMCILSYKGNEDFTLNNHHIKKGYILIKKTSNINDVACNKGQVHGKLFKWFFDMDPQGCTDVHGYGFSIYDGVWKYKSWTLNDRQIDGMVPPEITSGIQAAIQQYWDNGEQNYRVGNI